MIYISGASGLIGTALINKISDYVSISYRDSIHHIEFESIPNSTLIHLASCSNTRFKIEDAENLYQKDVSLSLQLFQKFLNKNPDGRIILLSSCGDLHWSFYDTVLDEYSLPSPRTIHGAHKLLLENYGSILTSKTDAKFISLRVSNVYGGQITKDRVNGFIDRYVYSFKNDESMQVYSNLNDTYDWVHMWDVIEAVDAAIKFNSSNTFLIGSEQSLSLKKVINTLKNVIGDVGIDILPCNNPATYVRINCTKAEDLLGWSAKIPFDFGLETIKNCL
jgi:UDP-glucose 4-epimerase